MKDHTSLRAWQEARWVSLRVLVLCRDGWKPWAAGLFSQLQRASLSVQLNIAEGATFNRSPTYARHLAIAYGSAVETCELIESGIEVGAIDHALGQELQRRARLTQQLLLGLLKRHRPMPSGT